MKSIYEWIHLSCTLYDIFYYNYNLIFSIIIHFYKSFLLVNSYLKFYFYEIVLKRNISWIFFNCLCNVDISIFRRILQLKKNLFRLY